MHHQPDDLDEAYEQAEAAREQQLEDRAEDRLLFPEDHR